jgi:hypothetical protein
MSIKLVRIRASFFFAPPRPADVRTRLTGRHRCALELSEFYAVTVCFALTARQSPVFLYNIFKRLAKLRSSPVSVL